MVKLSIIIPCYNEEKRIGSTLDTWLAYLKSKKWSFEIIVVNDGSKDNTEEVVKNFNEIKLLAHKPNYGKGYAVRRGILEANGEYILFCDADLSTPVEEIENLIKYVKNYEVVIASRALKESKVKALQSRKLLGRSFNFLVNLFAVPGIKDTQCGFKLFRRDAAKKIFSKQLINGWAFDVEVLFLAKKLGFKIKEVPIRWQHFEHDEAGTISPPRQVFKMFREILGIRWNSITGKYK